ncbi:MAG: hypothetical protein JNL90_15835 [Planctomycetes bacterium]|nr:hypothetical protein [Planctomycetota bacterium]
MPVTTVPFRLSFTLTVDLASGTPPFQSRTPLEQQAVKAAMLAPLRTPEMVAVETRWTTLQLPLGPNCCDPDLALLRNLVQTALSSAPSSQQMLMALGFAPTLTNEAPTPVCLVMPDGSHRCTRLFALTRGQGGNAWAVEGAGGVTGRIDLAAEWTTPQAPAGGGSGSSGGSGGTPSGGTTAGR